MMVCGPGEVICRDLFFVQTRWREDTANRKEFLTLAFMPLCPRSENSYFPRKTTPSFMTNCTPSSNLMSRSGSPFTAMMSA